MRPPLQLYSFESSRLVSTWTTSLERCCNLKYNGGEDIPEHNNSIASRLRHQVKIEPPDDLHITCNEVITARCSLGRNTAGGCDNIVPEFIQELPLIVVYKIAELLDARFQGYGFTPECWRTLLLAFIRKTARPNMLEDLRGLALISCMSKW